MRAYHQLRSLSSYADVYLFSVNDLGEVAGAEQELKKYCKKIHFVNITKARVALNVFNAYFSGIPLQVGYFYNNAIQAEFNRFADEVKADVIFCQLIRTALFVQNRKERKVLDYMDVFSKGVERRIDKVNMLMRPAFQMEYKRLLSFEEKVFKWFDERIIISNQDRDLIPHSEKKKIRVIPNGVDTSFFKPMESPKEFDILFNGNMQYPPNIEAAEYLCTQVLPLLRRKKPHINILISGTSPSPRVLALKSDNVVISGRVPDVRDNFAKSRILVAPMQSSIGLQNKLLEAMAMGIPCVTSTLANNALNAVPEKEILVADKPEEYAGKIFTLLENENLYKDIRHNALNFIENNCSWDKVNAELKKVLFV